MTDFNESNWARPDFSRQYIDNADIYIVERRRLFEILRSFYRHFLKDGVKKRVLDLGCGDGIVTDELIRVDTTLSATLIDGSEDMLSRAKERLKYHKDVDFVKASFQEIINGEIAMGGDYDLIVSSQAIHHLTLAEKTSLFERIYNYLRPRGYFVNIDVLLAPDEQLEQWYMSLWREWIVQKQESMHMERDFTDVINRYKDNKDNRPDTLGDQLVALNKIGFRNVDCFYKYGIFTVYGGSK